MKLAKRKAAKFESGPNMTPLVDVVMCILIFLMMVGTFALAEHYMLQKATQLAAATSESAAPPPPDFRPDDTTDIRLNMPPTGDRFIASIGSKRTSDPAELATELRRIFEQLQGAGQKKEDLKVIIRPSGDVKFEYCMAVYEAASSAGFESITYAMPN
jgi:biopolymer transport protein ExbD